MMDNTGLKFVLGISNDEQLNQFLHSCIDHLVNKSGLKPNVTSDLEWSKDEYATAQRFIQNIFKNLTSNPDYNLENEYRELNAKTIESIQKCYHTRENEIQHAVVNECLNKMGGPYVTDFDWKIKWVLGSSTSASIRDALIQIDFYTRRNRIELESIRMEMNSAQLSQFISQIENCLTNK